jgi:peptide/nickel transport system permease protein
VRRPAHLLRNHPALVVGGALTLCIVLVAVFAGWVSLHAPEQMDMRNRFSGPTAAHWLGTDNFGRDIWSRLAHGARVSLSISLAAVLVSMAAGSSVGLLAGYFGGWVDMVLMRVTDIFLGFPALVLSLAVIAVLGPGIATITLALALNFWAEYARVIRGATLSLREQPYVLAARSMGATHGWIIGREILPNAAGPIVVLATLNLGSAVLSESALSFLGFGVPPPTPTWGWTLAYGTRFLRSEPWLATVTGLAIMLTVLGFNLLGDGLRDWLDPRQVTGDLKRTPMKAAA